MSHAARLALVSLATASLWSSPGRAEFCSDLNQVAEIAAADNLASLGVGPAYTGPAIAGHEGEFPSDDTQNTTLRIAGATKCGLSTLPQLGTRFYSCDLPGGIEVWKSSVAQCASSISFRQDSDGVSARLGGASVSLAEYDPGVTRLDVAKWSDPDSADDWLDQ